ncbi:hypothetical protein JTB14_025674 [Gonioctena quinquepunctata]|nr:hypothetical protein JTB14_025674 [Gonioctena quinquepunctata]
MIDDASLIEQVLGFPHLYAKNDKRFKDKRARENVRETIACILEATPDSCEQRFLTLRNKYTTLKRESKNCPSGSSGIVVHWPHYKAMGFLEPYLHTRRSTSNYADSGTPQNKEWDSLTTITASEKENTNDWDDSIGDPSSTGADPQEFRECTIQSSSLKRKIPRTTIQTNKDKKEVLTEKISGCFDTLATVMREKYKKTEDQPDNSDEHFVRSLVKDSVFNQKQKIILKKKYILY